MPERAARANEPPADHVFLGNLGRVFGLEGALHFRPAGEAEAQAIFELDEVFVTGLGSTAIRDIRQHGNGLVVAFEGIRRPERARGLVNERVFAPAESLPVPSGGAIYADVVRGLPVLIDGRPFGTVADLAGVSGAELLLVDRPVGGQAMLPLRAPYVQVGPDAVLVVDPPPGLIDADGG
jgi:16S rRNA processing protein RimM